jgi:hypothetical protein
MRAAWAATSRALRHTEATASVSTTQTEQRVADLQAQVHAQTEWAKRLQEQLRTCHFVLFYAHVYHVF